MYQMRVDLAKPEASARDKLNRGQGWPFNPTAKRQGTDDAESSEMEPCDVLQAGTLAPAPEPSKNRLHRGY